MKRLKYYLFIWILIFPGRLFSQSFRPSEIIGLWQYDHDSLGTKITFKTNYTIEYEDKDRKNILSFTINTIGSGFLLIAQLKGESNSSVYYYKLKFLNPNQISLQIIKLKMYNKKLNT
jgi:hypothetical protein